MESILKKSSFADRIRLSACCHVLVVAALLLSSGVSAASRPPQERVARSAPSVIARIASQVDPVIRAGERTGVLGRCVETGRNCDDARIEIQSRQAVLESLRPELVSSLAGAARAAASDTGASPRSQAAEGVLARYDNFLRALAALAGRGSDWPPTTAALISFSEAALGTIHTAPPPRPTPGPPTFRPPAYRQAPRVGRSALQNQAASRPGLAGRESGAAPPPEYLEETPEVRFTPELDLLINQYHRDPLTLFGIVRDEVRYQPYYGSMKDSQHVLDTMGGNDLDQASLLIAVLRRIGVPARYVRGTVEIPIARARQWLGVTDSQTVGDILFTAGVPTSLVVDGGGTIVAVRLEHVWVEAWLDFTNYRGVANRAGGAIWVPLDPSFQSLQGNGGPDLATESGFDPDAFLDNFLLTLSSRSPAEQYVLDLQGYASTSYPGVNFYNVLWGTDTIPEGLETAPASLPYTTVQVLEATAAIPDSLRYKLRFQANGLDATASFVEIVGNRVTLAYEPATQADRDIIATYGNLYDTPPWLINVRPELRIAGALRSAGTGIGFGRQDTFTLQFLLGSNPLDTVTNTINAGGRYAVGLAAQDISSLIVYHRTALFDAGVASVGQPDFDTDDTLGESLFMHAMAYWQELEHLQDLTARSMQLIYSREPSEAIVGTALVVYYSGYDPVEVDPGGIYMDVDRSVVAPFSINGDPALRRAFNILSGSTGSSLENLIFEQIWGTDSVSTIKIIQLANEAAIPVFEIDASNRSTLVPLLTQPYYVIDAINSELDQGRTVTIPRDPLARYDWTGTGWISMDMATGAASYMISGGLMGGSFTQYQQYVENLVRTGEITREQGDELIRQARERIHLPVSDPVTSQFGERTHPVTGRQSFHAGVDLGSPAGTDVAAPADGTVARSYTSSSYGETVIINHGTDADGNTVYSLSAHNQTRLVNTGDTVTAGDQIADSGSTGVSTGPHLHYEIRVVPPGGPTPDQAGFFNRQYAVNPTDYMWPTLTPPPRASI